jgi:hypothetical protein
VNDRGRRDEAIGGIAVKAFEFASAYRKLAGERQFKIT